MSTQHQTDVIIVGAGIIGICCALSLLEKGKSVRLVDKGDPGQGTSYGNAGVISPSSCVPQSLPGLWKKIPKWLLDPEGPVSIRPGYLPKAIPWALKFLWEGRPGRVTEISRGMAGLNRPSVDLYRHHLSGTGHENLLRDCWYIHAYRNEKWARLEDLDWRLRAAQGASIELVSGDELREIEPCLSKEYEAAILIKDQARALAPGRLGSVLADKVRSLGGTFVQAEAHRLVPGEEGWTVVTDQGEMHADKIVVAAGAWSMTLLKPLGLALPLEAERGYHLVFRDPGVKLSNSIMEVDAKFVTSSMEMGVRSAGTAEFAGLEAPPNYRRARVLSRLTKRMLPELNTDDTEEWMGTRPTLPDSLPCIDQVPGMPGLFAAFGHSHYGLSMAPQTGRLVAELVTGATPNIDLGPYRADRFN